MSKIQSPIKTKQILLTLSPKGSICSSPKRRKKYFSKNERIVKYINELKLDNNFDGYAVKNRKMTISERLATFNNNGRKGKNRIFDSPFPFLYTVSKRKVLNYSNKLLPGILTYYNNKIIKKEEFTVHKRFNTNVKLYHTEEKLNKPKKNIFRSEYLRAHNINLFNTTHLTQDKLDYIEKIDYQSKKNYNQKKFLYKIKEDVIKLRFGNNLRINDNF